MSDLVKTILTGFLLALIAVVTQAQVAKKPATTADSSSVAAIVNSRALLKSSI